MTRWALIAPGPSARAEDVARAHAAGYRIGAVGNGFELAPMAEFIAATDAAWWRRYPKTKVSGAALYCMLDTPGVEMVTIPALGGPVNSGVLGLEIAKRSGAARILLLGFDMHGTHFFGKYTNGLRNTDELKRGQHLKQYAAWAKLNRAVEVINCTAGSALTCFPMADLDACLAEPAT